LIGVEIKQGALLLRQADLKEKYNLQLVPRLKLVQLHKEMARSEILEDK
jgi:hypothetical protein